MPASPRASGASGPLGCPALTGGGWGVWESLASLNNLFKGTLTFSVGLRILAVALCPAPGSLLRFLDLVPSAPHFGNPDLHGCPVAAVTKATSDFVG